ncbi:MAG: hypothetical protein H0T51_09985 [Pirellulales bacterium]|nr:hypothetical protein [Pirellulales bacterium]
MRRTMTFTNNLPYHNEPAYESDEEGLPLPNYDAFMANEGRQEDEREQEEDYGGLPLPDPDAPNADGPRAPTPWQEGFPYDGHEGFVTNAFGGPIEEPLIELPQDHRTAAQTHKQLLAWRGE